MNAPSKTEAKVDEHRYHVAQVAVFEDGSAVLRWLKNRNTAGVSSTVCYDSIRDLVWVHGHGDRKTGHLELVKRDDDA